MDPSSLTNSYKNETPTVSGICARVNLRVENAVAERKKAVTQRSSDQDRGKGAVEQDSKNEGGNTSMQGQLGHRDENAELKDADSDLSG